MDIDVSCRRRRNEGLPLFNREPGEDAATAYRRLVAFLARGGGAAPGDVEAIQATVGRTSVDLASDVQAATLELAITACRRS